MEGQSRNLMTELMILMSIWAGITSLLPTACVLAASMGPPKSSYVTVTQVIPQALSAMVKGLVLCDPCFHGNFTPFNSPLPGARVNLHCEDGRAADASDYFSKYVHTNRNGAFTFTVSNLYYLKHGVRGCKVILLQSPDPSCSNPSSLSMKGTSNPEAHKMFVDLTSCSFWHSSEVQNAPFDSMWWRLRAVVEEEASTENSEPQALVWMERTKDMPRGSTWPDAKRLLFVIYPFLYQPDQLYKRRSNCRSWYANHDGIPGEKCRCFNAQGYRRKSPTFMRPNPFLRRTPGINYNVPAFTTPYPDPGPFPPVQWPTPAPQSLAPLPAPPPATVPPPPWFEPPFHRSSRSRNDQELDFP